MEGQLKHHMKNPAAVEDVAGSIQEGGTSQRSRNEIQQLSPNKKESSGTADSTLQSSIYSTAEEDPHDVQSVSNGLNESSKKIWTNIVHRSAL